MGDAFQDITDITGGQTDVTPVGKVNRNAVLAQEEIFKRIEAIKMNKAKYPSSTNEKNFSIYPNELCFTFSKDYMKRSRQTKEYTPHVLSTFNGGFKKTDTLLDIIHELEFAGISNGSGANFDERSLNPSIDLALTIGGTRTIMNNSSKMIHNGALIMWSPPPLSNTDRGYELIKSKRNSERMTARIEVFDPTGIDSFTVETIQLLLKNNGEKLNQIVSRDELLSPIVESTKNLLEVFKVMFYLGQHSVIKATEYKKITDKFNKDNFIPDVYLQLLVGNLSLDTSLTGVENKKLVSAQKSLIHNLFAAINTANYIQQKRIIGKALWSAEPGKAFDIKLGRYMA